MKKLLLTTALAAGLASPVYATEAIWNLSSPSGALGTSQTYTADGFTITAYGFTNTSTWTGTDLFGKTLSGDEHGLGLTDDPTGENEISGTNFIQMNVSAAVAAGVTNFQFAMGSTTAGEEWTVMGGTTMKALTDLGSAFDQQSGDETLLTLPNNYNFYDFFYSGPSTGVGGANVLLSQFEGLEPSVTLTGGVPEPSTWVMMTLGFGLFGLVGYRKPRGANALA